MARYSSEDIDAIANTLRSARDRGKPAHMLIGAGCSKAAGIPLASEIVAEIHQRYSGYCRRLNEADRQKYGACMKLLSPNERRDLLAPYLARASINWAHIVLAQFMNEQFIERALTVNFDNLLARACGLLNLYPAVYDFASAPTENVALIVSPAIVHLHGQGHGVVLMNTEEETKAHAKNIAPVLRQSMDHPIVALGYSGTTDDVLRIVREQYLGSEFLYWLSHDADPDPIVRGFAEGRSYFKCVGGIDADRFLIELAQRLGCWPPTICTNPVGHLLAELKPVTEYPTIPDSEVNVLSALRSRLAELEKTDQQTEQATREIEKSFYEGRYDDAVRAFAAVPIGRVTEVQRNLAVAALLLSGNNLNDEAGKAADSEQAEKLFKQAEMKYQAALQIEPDSHDALNNWGVALSERARRARDAAAAEDLLKEAEGKYEAALRIKPDYHETVNNWGVALSERGRRARDAAAAEELLKQAEGKYDAALRLKPDDHEKLNNWGSALHERGRRASDPAAAEEFLKQAEGKYEAALRIKPDYDETLNNWGIALHERGRRARDAAAAEDLLELAEGKFDAALRLKPDNHETLNNWGRAIATRARRASGATAEVLFKQAEGKFEAALRLKPNDNGTLFALGSAMLEHAKRADARDQTPKLLHAAIQYLMAAKTFGNPESYNLACAYALLDQVDDCHAALEAAESMGALPAPDHMQRDDDLARVRDLSWFAEMIKRLQKKSA
jgi:Tfp pilus assembly protein PilF